MNSFIYLLYLLVCELRATGGSWSPRQQSRLSSKLTRLERFQLSHLDNLSIIVTSFSASYSFCASVISSIGFGIGSSTWPVMGLILKQVGKLHFNARVETQRHTRSNDADTDKGFADLYSSVSESSSSEYWVSPRPPARRPRATRSPAAFPYPVYFSRFSTTQGKHSRRG